MLILDVAAGKASLPCVTESLIISHSAPHTVARKMEEREEDGGDTERWKESESVVGWMLQFKV